MIFLLKKLLHLFPWLGNIIYKKELRTIRNSRYFDEKYYYFLRPDVFNSQKDAALHYLLYGWEEKTNPSEYFNTAEYLNAYPDVNFNPLLHYEWFGKNENKNIGIKPFLIEISNKQNETITNLENKLITIQNAISSLEDKFIFDKQQYTAIQEEQENKLTTIQNTVSFVQENLNFARRQTAEIQLVVQEEQKLRQNNTNQFEELKKQVNNIENSLQPKLAEQQNNFETKLTDLKFRFENHISNILQETEKNKKSFENTIKVIEEIKSYFSQNIDSLHANLTEQQNDFESKLAKAQLEQEKSFLNYQKQEHEKTVAREENTLKLQRDLFEVERSNSDLQNKISENTTKLEKISNLELRINSVDAKHSQKVRSAEESLWADIFNQTVNDSIWLKNKTFSPGRWAVGYPYLYVMYRVLNEVKPTNILELGLGVSTKIIGQYAGYYNNVNHTVVENDSEWIDFFNRDFKLSDNTKIEQLDWVFEPFEEAKSVRVFENFQTRFSNKQFDFISIDAPLGGDMKEYSRVDVCKILPHCLKKSFVIMIDDYERIGEKHTVEKMKEALNNAGIKYKTGIYSGKKDLLIFASEDLKFLCSM